MWSLIHDPKKVVAAIVAIAGAAFLISSLQGDADEVKPIRALSMADALAQEPEWLNISPANGTAGGKESEQNGKKEKEPEPQKVINIMHGIVTIQNAAAMPTGTVMAYGATYSDPIAISKIEPNGEYFLVRVPPGPIQILVTNCIREFDSKGRELPEIIPGFRPEDAERNAALLLAWKRLDAEGLTGAFSKIDKLYGRLNSPKKIGTEVFEGVNVFNIDLDVKNNDDKGEEKKQPVK